MAITVADIALNLRIITTLTDTIDAGQEAILTRLFGVGDAFTELFIPTAPDAIKDECRIRFIAYLYDQPTAAQGDRFGNAWKNSGAAALASPYRVRRASQPAEGPA